MQRILIANRGEIAIRIARAAAGLGIETVAIYAEADRDALHTAAATTCVALPEAGDPVATYLQIDAVIAAALDAGCDAVHPGYGFLSENASFAEACVAAGLTFIGPTAASLQLFGDKLAARTLAAGLDIPVVAGSEGPVVSGDEAVSAASLIGLPVMLKAAAGGGGRGMRAVHDIGDVADAFAACAREAEAAFGDGTVFVERLVERPRHIEVQVIADHEGNSTHLFERDCSIQLRNQKVVEVAPAPGLDSDVQAALHRDAVRLVDAAGYVNAGTVEFLVSPETGEYFFIECNPRIQVEHTITEQIMGVDLVQAQIRLAAGESLVDVGLDPSMIGEPRGWSIQSRVVAKGVGTITGWQPPSGPGVRVDASGYAGLTPSPHFDPLLAKVIVSTPGGSIDGAIDAARRAIDEFHIAGLDTNLASLAAILSDESVRAGAARTSLLGDNPALVDAVPSAASAVGALLARQGGGGSGIDPAPAAAPPSALRAVPVADDQLAVASPQVGQIVEISVAVGDRVHAGQTLAVVTAMKMETLVTSPSAGVVVAVADASPGDAVALGDVLAVVAPTEGDTPVPSGDDTWAPMIDDVATLQRLAEARLAPGSDDPGVVRQRSRNKLTCRERIDLLLDEGSFREVGSIAGFASRNDFGDIDAFTPANMVGGHGTIDERPLVVCADDFTSRGGHSDGAIAAKSLWLDRLSIELAAPSVRLLDGSSGGGSVASMVPKQRADEASAKESSGAIKAGRPRVEGVGGSFLPSHLGSTMYARQLSTVPVVNMLLGSVVGLGAAKAVLGHFSVMVRDIAQLFVAGPPVVSHAMGYDITKEELGDWRIHCTNGSVDNLAESEEHAAELTRQFLSYLPSSVFEAPPVRAARTDDPADRRDDELFTIVPRNRTTTFDIRRAIELMADRDSFFEIGTHWGTDQVVGFARFNGHPVGVIASDSRHLNGGALTADGCDKLTRHLDLCDLFHLPVLNLVDNPGFAVGIEHERLGTIRRGGAWMIAAAQTSVPLFTVIMRRSFGVAGNNYAAPRSNVNMRVVWPAADAGGIPPEGGIEAAYKRQLAEADDPAQFRAELMARIESARGPIGPLNRFEMEEMIDPRDTRRLVCEWLPTAYRLINLPANLGPRAGGFRP